MVKRVRSRAYKDRVRSRAYKDRKNQRAREKLRLARETRDPTNYPVKRSKKLRDETLADKKRRDETKERVSRLVKISDEDKYNAYLEARPIYEKAIQHVMDKNPGRQLLVSITLHGKNKSYTSEQEAIQGSLRLKNNAAIVIVSESGDKKTWKCLTRKEMQQMSDIPPQKLYEYSGSDLKGQIPDLARHVEFCLQLDVAHCVNILNDRRVLLLQNLPGMGNAHGDAPYSVNLRITVMNKNGTIPLDGAVFRKDIPYGTPYISESTRIPKVKSRKVSMSASEGEDSEDGGLVINISMKTKKKNDEIDLTVDDDDDDDKVVLLKGDDEASATEDNDDDTSDEEEEDDNVIKYILSPSLRKVSISPTEDLYSPSESDDDEDDDVEEESSDEGGGGGGLGDRRSSTRARQKTDFFGMGEDEGDDDDDDDDDDYDEEDEED